MADPSSSFLDQYQAAAAEAADPVAGAKAQMQLVGQWIAVSPVAFFNELREKSPILKAPAFTLVTQAKDVQDVLTLNDIFTTDLLKQNMLRFIGQTVVELPPSPEYERRKSILRLAFPMQDVTHYREILLDESAKLTQNAVDGNPFDLIAYAKQLPAAAISRYLGLAELPTEKVVQWMHDINEGAVRNLGNSPQVNERAAAASLEVKTQIQDTLQRTRSALSKNSQALTPNFFQRLFRFVPSAATPELPQRPTVLDRYLVMQSVPTTYTTDDDIISSLLFLMSACVDLTAIAITNVVIELMQRPEVLKQATAAAVQDKDDEFAGYVWEALRFRQPSPGVINTCAQDYTLGRGTAHEQTITAGTLVMGCSISAMHDASVIESPAEFRTGRPWHLAYTFFEAGLHTCHGKYFSMTQIPLAVKQLLKLGNLAKVDEFPASQGYPTKSFHIKVIP